jgi:hypothetical protein
MTTLNLKVSTWRGRLTILARAIRCLFTGQMAVSYEKTEPGAAPETTTTTTTTRPLTNEEKQRFNLWPSMEDTFDKNSRYFDEMARRHERLMRKSDSVFKDK